MNNYLVRPPFLGYCQTSTYFDASGVERANFSGYLYNNKGQDLTVDEYLRLPGHENLIKVSNADFDLLLKAHEQSLVSKPVKIDISEWSDKLEVLPPCRWQMFGPYECFYVSERITGDIVSWYCLRDGIAFTFDDESTITSDQIVDKLNEVWLV